MAKINVIQGSQVAPGQAPGGYLNMGQMLQAGAGTVGIGRGLGSLGAVTENMALRLQAAKNAADISRAEQEMKKTFAAYQEELTQKPDEQEWVPGWEERSMEAKEAFLNREDLAPEVRDRLEIAFNDWETESTIRVSGQANQKFIQRQKAVLSTAADEAFTDGDVEAGNAKLEEMASLGLIHPEEIATLQKKGQQKASFSLANRAINEDAIAAEALLEDKTPGGKYRNFTGLDENQRQSLVIEARREQNYMRAETMRDITEQRLNGRKWSKDELMEFVDQKKLTSTQVENILRVQSYSGDDPKMNDLIAQTLTAIDNYEPTNDPENKEYTRLLIDLNTLPARFREKADARLNRVANSKDPTTKRSDPKIALDRLNFLYENNYFGNILKMEGEFDDPEAANRANQRLTETRLAFYDWLAVNPNPTSAQIQDWLDNKLEDVITNADEVIDFATGRAAE